LLERARRADSCHREYPVVLPLERGELLEGSIDLAFVEGRNWVVVDFKSDVTAAGPPPNYVRQVQWYALALRRTVATEVEGWILAV
jgi:ATP-dependent exoDNAse (exonuclease V) beta subunit